MEFVKTVSHLFLFSLAFGNLLFSTLVDPKLTGTGLNKVIITISGVGVLLAVMIYWTQGGPFLGKNSLIYYTLLATHLLLYFGIREKRSIVTWLLYSTVLALFIFQSMALTSLFSFDFLFFVSSMALTGIVCYAMVLGHWYLVVPKLSERPLLLCLKVMGPILLAKFFYGLFSTWQNWSFFTEGTQLGGGYIFNWILLLMRMGWGYIALIVLAIFTWKLVKIRSIQSATGLLYVMVFFLLGGELISLYMALNYGLYL